MPPRRFRQPQLPNHWRVIPDTPQVDRKILFLLAVLVFTAGLGLRDPWPADEPRFALVAKEMVETGNWLFPHRNGELYPDKPPLFMWLIAAGYAATGSMRLAFLLPSLLAGLGTLWLVTDLARRLWNRRVGLYAGWTLLFCFQFTWQARGAQIDALLCFWTTLGFYGFLRHILLGPEWRWYWCACAAVGAGIITKGVGFLPLLLFIPYGIARWRGTNLPWLGGTRAWWRWCVGLLLALGVIAAWLVPMWLAVEASNDPALRAYRDNILFQQTITRYVAAAHHFKPWWYFAPQALALWLPLTLLLPWASPAWWRRLRRNDARTTLLLGSCLLILIFFSLSKGKRGVYILPAAPLLALALSPLLPGLLTKVRIHAVALAAVVATACALALAAMVVWFIPDALRTMHERGIATAAVPTSAAIVVILAAFWCLRERRRGVACMAGFIVCGWLLFGWIGLPLYNRVNSPAAFMAAISEQIGPDAELGMLRWREQYALLSPRKLTTFGYGAEMRKERADALAWLGARHGRWLLLPEDRLGGDFDRAQSRDIGFRHGVHWFLAPGSALLVAPHQDYVSDVHDYSK
jgi:4-amino-4-deoxy-L-arabinose transferase-like glycosyltransferase